MGNCECLSKVLQARIEAELGKIVEMWRCPTGPIDHLRVGSVGLWWVRGLF